MTRPTARAFVTATTLTATTVVAVGAVGAVVGVGAVGAVVGAGAVVGDVLTDGVGAGTDVVVARSVALGESLTVGARADEESEAVGLGVVGSKASA